MQKVLYAQIEKAEPQSDGTVKVYGYASSSSEDSDGEIVTPDAIASALPDYLKFGAVREMHQPKAAGTAIEAKVMDDGRTWFGAHVVDSEAVKKVQAKVYKGFSIGGKVLTRDPDNSSIITGIKLVEVSLVDRPANPDAVFTMYKAEDPDKPKHEEGELAAIDQLSALVNKGDIAPSKLVELAQAFIKGYKTVEKSFWDIAELAHLLGCLKSLQSSVAFDAAYEGETSEVSVRLKQHVNDLTETLVEMIGEELVETTSKGADTMTDTSDPKLAKSDEAKEDPKAEAKEPASEAKKEDDGEDTVEEAAKTDDEGAEKSATGDDLAKADDILAKFSDVVNKALDPIVKRLEHLEGQPAPAKGVLKTIGKAEDVNKGSNADEDTSPAGLSPEQLAAWEIKKLHKTGGLIG
ncbi:MAG: hypothetical protein A4E20_12180 [Nitrospira sp. SG-bin2]|uniref:hypothetical protein n=1 Tax=Nitrospira cf. moscoviensis SBR1015 TaxID=96242 RepID=UPI000A0E4410|nr:hypothetical protein [Nitrospira cf. moscoviensis SBR1015]OQW33979.1 MAG: hypothetical protein A4E20_12180 [Nitrospira sp. SG-bin2]